MFAYAINETWKDVELLVYKTIHQYRKLHGGDWNELLSEAGWSFMRAYRTYDRERGAFSTWVVYRVWKGLQSHRRKESKRVRQMGEGEAEAFRNVEWDHRELLELLGQDARVLFDIVLGDRIPVSLLLGMELRGNTKPENLKRSIWKFLREMGWSAMRVAESFKEIKEIL